MFKSLRPVKFWRLLIATLAIYACSGSDSDVNGGEGRSELIDEPVVEIPTNLDQVSKIWRRQSLQDEFFEGVFVRINANGQVDDMRFIERKNCYEVRDRIAFIRDANGGLEWLDAIKRPPLANISLVDDKFVLSFPSSTQAMVKTDIDLNVTECVDDTFASDNFIPIENITELAPVWSLGLTEIVFTSTDEIREYNFLEEQQCFYEDTSERTSIEYIGGNIFTFIDSRESYRSAIYFDIQAERLFLTGRISIDGDAEVFTSTALGLDDISPICPSQRSQIQELGEPVADLSLVDGAWQAPEVEIFFDFIFESGDTDYLVFRSNQSFSLLDYRGDVFDLGEDCVSVKRSGQIVRIDSGRFEEIVPGEANQMVELYLLDGSLHLIRPELDEDFDRVYSPVVDSIDLEAPCPR